MGVNLKKVLKHLSSIACSWHDDTENLSVLFNIFSRSITATSHNGYFYFNTFHGNIVSNSVWLKRAGFFWGGQKKWVSDINGGIALHRWGCVVSMLKLNCIKIAGRSESLLLKAFFNLTAYHVFKGAGINWIDIGIIELSNEKNSLTSLNLSQYSTK